MYKFLWGSRDKIKRLKTVQGVKLGGLNMVHIGGDKVSTLTHAYPHKPLRKIKVTLCNHLADSPLCMA